VILLTVGYKAIVESQDEAAAYLVRQIAAEPDEHGDNVVLAGRCLADVGPGLVPADCWGEVIEELIPVMQDLSAAGRPNDPSMIPTPTRYAAGETLDRLGWLPLDLDSWIEVPAPVPESPISSLQSQPSGCLYVARYLVTNHQFSRFIDAGGYEEPGYWGGERSEAWQWRVTKHGDYRGKGPVSQPEYWDDPRFGKSRRGYPVVGISWYEANAYCAWMTEGFQVSGFKFQAWRDGEVETLDLDPGALAVRLPTEEEWMAAAGGGEGDRYPWGKWQESCANTREGGIRGTTPVAMYPAGQSSHGVWDMGGNVWEWMAFERGEYSLRGGSWLNVREDARVAARYDVNPDYSNYLIGLRVVGSPAGPES